MMTSFDEKLNAQFSSFTIRVPDHAKNLEYLYADYVELIALFSNSSYVSTSDISDRLKEDGLLRNENETNEEITVGEANDENESWINQVFEILEYRAVLYSADYPFEYANNKIIRKAALSDKNELYIFLLISSNLDLFKFVRSELTTDFETISYYALKNFLPVKAVVKQFGKNSDYSGNAVNKIRSLATDLKMEVKEEEVENISERNNQERGLDVIGWIPFSDNCPNIITILGQCACGKEWPGKQHDTRRFSNYLKFFKTHPYHAIFIPYALIGKNAGKSFYRSDDIELDTLVFERKRIIELFDNKIEFDALESKQIVSKCVEFVEDIV